MSSNSYKADNAGERFRSSSFESQLQAGINLSEINRLPGKDGLNFTLFAVPERF